MRTVVDQGAGVKTLVQLNHDGSLTTGTVQDCEPILERTKTLHSEGMHGSSEMRLAASIPVVVVEKWCNDNGVSYQELSRSPELKRRMLNDPSLGLFRVWKGRV